MQHRQSRTPPMKTPTANTATQTKTPMNWYTSPEYHIESPHPPNPSSKRLTARQPKSSHLKHIQITDNISFYPPPLTSPPTRYTHPTPITPHPTTQNETSQTQTTPLIPYRDPYPFHQHNTEHLFSNYIFQKFSSNNQHQHDIHIQIWISITPPRTTTSPHSAS